MPPKEARRALPASTAAMTDGGGDGVDQGHRRSPDRARRRADVRPQGKEQARRSTFAHPRSRRRRRRLRSADAVPREADQPGPDRPGRQQRHVGPWTKDDPDRPAGLGRLHVHRRGPLDHQRHRRHVCRRSGKYDGQPHRDFGEAGRPRRRTSPSTSAASRCRSRRSLRPSSTAPTARPGSSSVDAKLRNTSISDRARSRTSPAPAATMSTCTSRSPTAASRTCCALAIDAPKPLLVGDVSLESTFLLPPGQGACAGDGCMMAGRFGLDDARFTDRRCRQSCKSSAAAARARTRTTRSAAC